MTAELNPQRASSSNAQILYSTLNYLNFYSIKSCEGNATSNVSNSFRQVNVNNYIIFALSKIVQILLFSLYPELLVIKKRRKQD